LLETELWYIIFMVVKALRQFKNEGYFHGDIQTRTIHISKSGEVILIFFIFPRILKFFSNN